MQIRVRLFAVAKDLAEAGEVAIDLADGASVADLRQALGKRVPALAAIMPRLLVAVDSQYAVDTLKIPPGAEVAVIPPVSGG